MLRKASVARMALGMLPVLACAACSKPPPPKAPDSPKEEQQSASNEPVVAQELGSIDDTDVNRVFNTQQLQLEDCLAKGRQRIEFLSGDVKVFLRIDAQGQIRYSYFEESSLGDRDTEKCILDVLGRAAWPKPVGGEAEVRHGFGFDPGGERAPVTWEPEKVTNAIDATPKVKRGVEQCKRAAKGDFHITGYVASGAVGSDANAAANTSADASATADASGAAPAKPKKKAPKKPPKKGGKGGKDKGHFQALGVAATNKDAAAQIDCVVDALKSLALPNPGGYAAKVSFTP
jgi:hypothetical protein